MTTLTSLAATCRTLPCGEQPTVTLAAMCVNEHLTENSYCEEHASFLFGLSEREGFVCYECRSPLGPMTRRPA